MVAAPPDVVVVGVVVVDPEHFHDQQHACLVYERGQNSPYIESLQFESFDYIESKIV